MLTQPAAHDDVLPVFLKMPVTVFREQEAIGTQERLISPKAHHTAMKMTAHSQIRSPFHVKMRKNRIMSKKNTAGN